jgi:hypothetical protein
MKVLKIIEKRLRGGTRDANTAADVHGVIAANVGEGGARTHVSSHSRHRIVQRGGRTVVNEHEHETETGKENANG